MKPKVHKTRQYLLILACTVLIVAVGSTIYWLYNVALGMNQKESPSPTQFFLTTMFSVCVLAAVLAQIIVNLLQWRAMQKQSEQTKELFVISERAYIGLDEVPPVNLKSNESLEMLVNLMNTGKTPAQQLEVTYSHGTGVGWSDDVKISFDEFSKPITVACALPGKIGVMIRKEAIEGSELRFIARRSLIWYTRIAFRYIDFQEKRHTDSFFVMFRPENGLKWDETEALSGNFCGVHLADSAYIEEKKTN